jgi:hypothetical protein
MKAQWKEGATDAPEQGEPVRKKNKALLWLKRLGVAGFIFFLVKGILWLTVGAALLRAIGCED